MKRALCHADEPQYNDETAVHCCHCPGDMALRMYWVLARPWVGVCVPLSLSLSHSQQFIKYPKIPKISVSKSARLVPGGGGTFYFGELFLFKTQYIYSS